MRKILNNEKGATTIVVAIAIVWIVALCALVVDVGLLVIEKQNLQYAVDAASLAAAQELPNTSSATQAAQEYIGLNGYSADAISISYNADSTEVEVQAQTPVQFFFAPAFGMDSTNLVRSATAQVTSGGYHAVFDYALFSGSSSRELIPNGEGMNINGDVHTNDSFRINGSNVAINGAVEAVGSIRTNGSNIYLEQEYPNHTFVDMPDYSETIKEQAIASGKYYTGDKIFNGSNIDVSGSMYVEGKVIIIGGHFTGKGFIFAKGEIVFNGSTVYQSTNDAVAIYSESEKITLNGNNMQFQGILYSPNNEITLNGNNMHIDGRVIGNTVILNGTDISITASTRESQILPTDSLGSIKLIK